MKHAINPVEILTQLSWGESEDLEFKSAKGGLPLELWETYSAMANTFGGIILLGVQNDGIVTGVDDINKIKRDFWNTINNRGKVSINLLAQIDVQEINHPQGNLLAIRVPKVGRREGPVFIGQNPLSGTFRRNSDGDYRCTEREIKRMLSDSDDESADSRFLENFTMPDLDLQSIHQYRNHLRANHPNHPWIEEDDRGLLRKLNALGTCSMNGSECVTVAGMLMFGSYDALNRAIPQYHVDYREKFSSDPFVRWTDRLFLDGTWPGNLFQFYIRVIQKLSSDLKTPFQLDQNLFRRSETPVHIAVREALVNALIHADHRGQGGVVIIKYPDRFEFSNPGLLLISIHHLLRGGISECRNRILQNMFTLIGAAEKAGSGVDKILAGWSSQHWRSPLIRQEVQPDRVTWVLPMVSLIPDESLQRLKRKFGSKFSLFNPLEVQALVTADIEGFVDNARMRQITDCHPADLTKLLQTLASKGILRQDGRGRWTQYYLPNEMDVEFQHAAHPEVSAQCQGLTPEVSSQCQGLTPEVSSQCQGLPAGCSVDLEERLKALVKKPNPEEMIRVIRELCLIRPFTPKELATILNKSREYLRKTYLTPMVALNELELLYPNNPAHPQQAYRTIELARKD